MNEQDLRILLEGGGGRPGAVLRAVLWLPGKVYGLLMLARRSLYRRGWLASGRPDIPIVSIGNLVAGGTGKTPLVILLANRLAERGRKPGILLRGYRATDGHSDEAELYRKHCPGAVVEADARRRAGAERATAAGADILLMDDGFQHLPLRRDLDLVLIDARCPWGGGNTFPGGLLREPARALRHADIVILSRADQVDDESLARIRREASRLAPGVPILAARHRPARLSRLDGSRLPLESLAGRKVVALSGIARPEAFHATLASLGAEVADAVAGRDHDHLSMEKIRRAVENAVSIGGVVVTTEKDRAKKIFAALADNISVDNTCMADILLVLGIEQEVEGLDALLARMGEISPLQFGETRAQ